MQRLARLGVRPHAVSPQGLYPFVAVVLLFVLSAGPAAAGYTWCSRDPVLTFSRGLLPDHVVDVQVAINGGSMSFADADIPLNVLVPGNVRGWDVLAPVTEPAFNVYTSFSPTLAAASSEAYSVVLDAYVPATYGAFDTALVITGAPLDGFTLGTLQVACGGRTGQYMRAKVSFAPLQVYCEQDTGWILAFG